MLCKNKLILILVSSFNNKQDEMKVAIKFASKKCYFTVIRSQQLNIDYCYSPPARFARWGAYQTYTGL